MSTTVYRAATREAIKDIISEQGQMGRFGLLLSEDSLEATADRICDFIDTTLKLRSGVRERMEKAMSGAQEETEVRTPTTPTMTHRLPRTRVSLSESERNNLIRSR